MSRGITGRIGRCVPALALTVTLAGATAGCSLFGGGSGSKPITKPTISVGPKGVKGALASVQRPYQGYNIHVDIVSLTRYDKVMRLVFVVIPRSAGNSDAMDADTFGSEAEDDVSGVQLADTKNMQVYNTMKQGSGDNASCACSGVGMDGYQLDQPTTLYADFPAPSQSTDTLTVVVPKVGPIPNVKVSS